MDGILEVHRVKNSKADLVQVVAQDADMNKVVIHMTFAEWNSWLREHAKKVHA